MNSVKKILKDNLLIDNKKFRLVNNPKISITSPILNVEKYLDYSLHSIQNEKMKEFEIILIDDYWKNIILKNTKK